MDDPEIVRMRERCNNFVPGLENAELDPDPFVQGLRPFRDANVRVERELRSKPDGSPSHIIHSYGQGGSGFTLSYVHRLVLISCITHWICAGWDVQAMFWTFLRK